MYYNYCICECLNNGINNIRVTHLVEYLSKIKKQVLTLLHISDGDIKRFRKCNSLDLIHHNKL